MKAPSETTARRLYALSGNNCAFPGCSVPVVEVSGSLIGEICHIKARNPGGPRYDPQQTDADRHSFSNLILLCPRHHKLIDSEPDRFPADMLLQMKAVHETAAGRPDHESYSVQAAMLLKHYLATVGENNIVNIAVSSPGAIQAHTVNIRSSKAKTSVPPPPGTIGADQQTARYVAHLISRYNEFAAKEPSRKTKFNFGAISRNIETNFGSKWQYLPMERFKSVCEYLQGRIAATRQAKINKGKGWPAFSTFDEFVAKHG